MSLDLDLVAAAGAASAGADRLYRILSDDGSALEADPPDIPDKDLVAVMAEMVKARVANGRFFSLQRQGRAGTYAPIEGQEAAVVGAVAALDPARDWVLPQYREPVALGRYGPEVLRTYALYQRGHPAGGHFPAPIRVFPVQISLAAQIPHALGLAWAMQLKGEAGVACAFFGDGASSEGDFYEAGNFAGVLGAPVLFLCVNNGWAISTPLHTQTAAPSFAAKAAAFGFPGVRVDGNDALAMISVVAAARERAVAGGGPTLVEAVTFRMGPHTTADDPKRYQAPEERAAWEGRDPIRRLRRHLEGRGLWSDERQAAAEAAAGAEVDAAWDRAEAMTVSPDAFFDHVYAEPTPRMRVQRAEVRSRFGLGPEA
ncbi:MAG TPA: thiamine pyrophosphate-dependent enzyme [Acidimicrobiia bacterium]|nr:thiamine pyrophosphate-dependent enzyme [Acidimicrobiia bacterium]